MPEELEERQGGLGGNSARKLEAVGDKSLVSFPVLPTAPCKLEDWNLRTRAVDSHHCLCFLPLPLPLPLESFLLGALEAVQICPP